MIENIERIGNFTSSEIWKLQTLNKAKSGFGALGLSYIEEKKLELKLGRATSTSAYSRPMAWGSFLEMYVDTILPFEYELVSNLTDLHPHISYWAGSKDFIVRGVKISELKCYQPKKFAQYTDAILTNDLEIIKKSFPQEYWQMVSNANINGVDTAEAITFMPYKSELDKIRELADNYDGANLWDYKFIVDSEDADLPYLPDNGFYKNLNVFSFKVPKEDVALLTNNVIEAGNELKITKEMLNQKQVA